MEYQKRKRNWYSDNRNKRKQHSIDAGMKGFLCTCNLNEKECVRDTYKLLNEFFDKSNNEGKCQSEDLASEADANADEDISAALSKEINELQAEGKSGQKKKFQVVETKVKNVLFIESTIEDPLTLAMSIIKEVYETKEQRSRFLLRLLPVEIVCKANMEDLRNNAEKVLEKYFSQEPKTFSIIFNRHSNSNMKRDIIIEDLATIISNKNPGNKADLKNPEIAVIVEAIRGFCLISVAPNYMLYKKYNLLEMCNPTMQKSNEKKCEGTAESDDAKNDVEATKDSDSENSAQPTDSVSENATESTDPKDNGDLVSEKNDQ